MENYIRLKTSLKLEHIHNRIDYHPFILEFHLTEHDLNSLDIIMERIQYAKSKGIKVYLHHPTAYQGKHLNIISNNKERRQFFDWSTKILINICKQENVQLVIHAHYSDTESAKMDDSIKKANIRKRIEYFQEIGENHLLWENTTAGYFSYQNEHFISDFVKPLDLPLCFDVSHAFISLKGDNQKLKTALETSKNYIKYFHVVDSLGKTHDALPLGKGNIDWKLVKPYLRNKDFIFEVDLHDSAHKDCTPMIESSKYLRDL